jgi:hypothetical protein
VVHLTPHRIRIKIPPRERQDAYFAALQRMLEQCPDVVSVHVNALVASIVIHYRDGFEITSVRNCLLDLELALPDDLSASLPARQIASDRRVGGRSKTSTSKTSTSKTSSSKTSSSKTSSSNNSISLVSLIIKLTIAIVTKRLEAVIRELIVEAVVRVLLPRLYRKPMPRLGAPRALLAAAAE